MENKHDLRIKAKNIRKNLNMEKISQQILSAILNLDIFNLSEHIMLFYPLQYEVNLLNLLNVENKKFYLPRINGEDLECCPYKKHDLLKLSFFKTKEPISKSINPQILDLIFVPALMVDTFNYRLGYGKGFYDRFLQKTNAYTIVPIAKELLVENLPIDSYDKPVNLVITQ